MSSCPVAHGAKEGEREAGGCPVDHGRKVEPFEGGGDKELNPYNLVSWCLDHSLAATPKTYFTLTKFLCDLS